MKDTALQQFLSHTWTRLWIAVNLLECRSNLLAVLPAVEGTGVSTFALPRFDAATARSAAHGPV